MMSAGQVLDVLDLLDDLGAMAWVDGGWGIDALIGRETRSHDDLDLSLDVVALEQVLTALAEQGYQVERDELPTAIALRHADGRAVDIHPIHLTADGGGDQMMPDGVTRWHYDPPGQGTIGGRIVTCLSVATQLRAHAGYELDAQDRADIRALCSHFNLPLPFD